MKKLLTLLLALLMVFTLVGCNSKQEEPPVEDEPKQEVVEPVQEEIVGGYVDVEDGTLTDELKDIFNKALEGLMGATYEPVELVATQVVAGTNYKFLANGTKTTNPVTKGTYYITIYKDLQGNVELLDIEVIEEKQEEVKTQDITQMSFWVVFYDQYDNELQREALKYGTVPTFKGTLPEGFDKWVYKKSGKDVDSLKAITGNTYYQAVCHEVYHSSSVPTPEPTPVPACPHIGIYLYYIYDENGDYFECCEYKYENNLYVFDTSGSVEKTLFNGFGVGDWVHFDRGPQTLYGECVASGDNAILPEFKTLTFNTNGVEATNLPTQTKAIYNHTISEPKVTPMADDYEFGGWYKDAKCTEPWNFYSDVVTEDTTLYAKWEFVCLAKGTLITMADGSKKPIEDLKEGDDIKVFNHKTGGLSNSKILDYWHYDEPQSGLITLHFTNNIDVNIVVEHSFYCKEEKTYVILNRSTIDEYIGKKFYNADNDCWEILLGASYSNEKVDTYYLATENHFNCVAQGMLNVEDGVYYVLCTTFAYDGNMKIDKQMKDDDIKRYGLFTYDDFDYLTKDEFDSHELAYLKVALGKNLISEADLELLKDIWTNEKEILANKTSDSDVSKN